jgi:hypothetical protein
LTDAKRHFTMSTSNNMISDDCWAIDYIDETVRLDDSTVAPIPSLQLNITSPVAKDTGLFSKLPGPSYNDTVVVGEEHIDICDAENITEITDPELEIPKDTMAVLNYMNHITGNLHRKFKDLVIDTNTISDDTLVFIIRQLTALLRYTDEMCKRFQQVPIEHSNRSPLIGPQVTPGDIGLWLVRSSYKFCENSASCKVPKCRQHHFVFNRLYGDLLSLQKYIEDNPGKWNVCEATRSINTVYFVVSHMHHEQHAMQTVGIYNRAIASSQTLQHTAPVIKLKETDDWTEVVRKKRH